MGEFLKMLSEDLTHMCPTFLQVPPQTPYPYMTVEAENILQGLPWGPSVAIINVKIWSRYTGTQEILKFAKSVEDFLQVYAVSLKIMESTLVMLKDGQTRVHSFRLKVRISGGAP